MTTAAPVTVSGLTKRYGPRTVVDDLSFTVAAGRVTGFLGPNGAGKSTTLRMILGLVHPSSGTALINGRPFTDLPDPARHVGVLLDAAQIHPGRSGRAHLRALAAASGLPPIRVDEVLDQVGLTGDGSRRVGTYSLGMRQRLGIAAALLGDPGTIVLDEPTNGLDPDGIAWLRRLLIDFARDGRCVLVSSHQLAEVQQMADHCLVIAQGRLRADAPTRTLTDTPDGARFTSPDPAATWAHHLASVGAQLEVLADGYLAHGCTPAALGQLAHQHGLTLSTLEPLHRSLEQAFDDLTADHLDHPTQEPRP